MIFPLMSTIVKDIAKYVPIMVKTMDFEFSYFSTPLVLEKHLGPRPRNFPSRDYRKALLRLRHEVLLGQMNVTCSIP